jgi:peptidoglycan hydrolase-like protein with peptidoglycan-binding domain
MSRAARTAHPTDRHVPKHRSVPQPAVTRGGSARAWAVGSVALTLPAAVAVPASLPTSLPTSAPIAPVLTAAVPLYPTPVPAKPLSNVLDIASGYLPQDSCDPAAKPGVTAFMNLILATYKVGFSDGIVRDCGIGGTSEHKEGRAWDWAIPATTKDRATAQYVVNWLSAGNGQMARRFGIMYIIWDRHIWGVYRPQDGWRAYSGESAHTDHVHFSFSWDGAEKRTSWWTGVPVSVADRGPCQPYAGQPAPIYTGRTTVSCSTPPTPPHTTYALVWPGQTTSSVKVAQRALGVTADGTFGAGTRTALIAWQKTHQVPVTGVLDAATWAKLVPATPPAPVNIVAPVAHGTLYIPPLSTSTLERLAHTTSVSSYLKTVVREGSSGKAVRALQVALAIAPYDGQFGPITLKAVKAFQTSRHLKATGVVDSATWTQVQHVAYPLLGYRLTVLRDGAKGAAVALLQKQLKVTADGEFSARTVAAVKAFQKSAHLSSTGVVAVQTWIALEARNYPLGHKRW